MTVGNGVVIATTTFSKTLDTRANLAFQTARRARAYDFRIVVVDGGSPESFRKKLQEYGAVLLDEEEQGMGKARRQAIREAARIAGEGGVVVWMEPEKVDLIEKIWPNLVWQILSDRVDLVVPARWTLASYPEEQQYAEKLGNLAFRYLTGYELDVWFGPRVIGPRALPYFLEYDGEYGDKWDSIFVPLVRAIADGLRIVGVEVDYTHPAEQTDEEEGNIGFLLKRIEQLQNLIPALREETQKLGVARTR